MRCEQTRKEKGSGDPLWYTLYTLTETFYRFESKHTSKLMLNETPHGACLMKKTLQWGLSLNRRTKKKAWRTFWYIYILTETFYRFESKHTWDTRCMSHECACHVIWQHISDSFCDIVWVSLNTTMRSGDTAIMFGLTKEVLSAFWCFPYYSTLCWKAVGEDVQTKRSIRRIFLPFCYPNAHCHLDSSLPLLWKKDNNLVDSASSHTLVSKIKPCMSKYKSFYFETANGSLYQL